MIRLLAFIAALAVSGAAAADTLSDKIEAALAAQGKLASGARVELDNPALRDAEDGTVDSAALDARTARVVAFVNLDDQSKATRVTGRLRWVLEVPVLNRVLAPGEAIGPRDLDRVELRSDRISAAIVTDAGELVGKTAKRSLRPGEPLRATDVQTPIVVKKGELVTIVLEAPALRLTAQGKAVEDGGQGATIRVANTKSNRVIDAVVTGPGTVAVGAPRAN